MSSEPSKSRIAVLLFTDMVDSVGMERRLGTEAYSRLLLKHHALFRRSLDVLGAGKIHADTGDGLLTEFTTAADAVKTALLFQSALAEESWESETPRVRIGIHQGQLAEIQADNNSRGKIVGIPVSIASRVMGLAQAGQILMTRAVYEDARQFVREHPGGRRPAGPLRWTAHGAYFFKGTDEPMEVFEVAAAGSGSLTPPPDSEKAWRAGGPQPQQSRKPRPWAAATVSFAGLILLVTPLGDGLVHASYDTMFRFGTRVPTNKVALVLMDTESCEVLKQQRENWDRGLHAELLRKCAEAGSRLVVFDVLFRASKNPETDAALAAAMRQHGKAVLMARLDHPERPGMAIDQVATANDLFTSSAAGTGIGAVLKDGDEIVRRHWPFPAPANGQFQSLPWAAAEQSGARLPKNPQEQWLRYYGEHGAWRAFPYHIALSNAPSFRDHYVFVGAAPLSRDAGTTEPDKFRTPFTRWTARSAAGVEVLATEFLNLLNEDWLRRLPLALEVLLVLCLGPVLGLAACWGRWLPRVLFLGSATGTVALLGIASTHFSNIWFPWLIVLGGQIPCAIAFAISTPTRNLKPAVSARPAKEPSPASPKPPLEKTLKIEFPSEPAPAVQEYELVQPPFGEGGFGKVWLARNAIGQWQALKAIYRAKFPTEKLYETEFEGIRRYKPVSEKHAGLLRIELVSSKRPEGYFYYVMELADAQDSGWEQDPRLYRPRTLGNLLNASGASPLPVPECVEIGTALAEAVEFLHAHHLAHRDIKPSNVIFVNGRPKLADVGLVTNARPQGSDATRIGTPGYMPPEPEVQGTFQADIYALGMLLFVIRTAQKPGQFSAVQKTLTESQLDPESARLNAIILKACRIDLAERYQTVTALRADLARVVVRTDN